MFKLEKVMDDFHASAPDQRQPNYPNLDFVPFEEMKTRILRIVESYIGWVKKVQLYQNDHKYIPMSTMITSRHNQTSTQDQEDSTTPFFK